MQNINQKKKIAVIFPKDSEAMFNVNSTRTFGGASVQLYNIVKELSSYKEIITYSLIPQYDIINFLDHDKFRLIMLYKETDNIIVKMFKMLKFLLNYKPDYLIQRGLTVESCFLAIVCKLLQVKMIFMFAHDREVNGKLQRNGEKVFFIRLLLNNATFLITQNEFQQENLLKSYNKNSKVIYSGYPINEYIDYKSYLNKKKYILWVSRGDKWKQAELFLYLAQKNSSKKFLMIFSKSTDDLYYNEIKNKALKIKNCDFIEFVPYFNIIHYFEEALLFINTSLYEGFPNTFIQAFMSCTPVLSLHVNPDDVLTKHECGVYCKGDIELMNIKIHELLNDKDYYVKLSQNAYNYAKNHHNIKKTVKELLYYFRL